MEVSTWQVATWQVATWHAAWQVTTAWKQELKSLEVQPNSCQATITYIWEGYSTFNTVLL